MRIQSIYKFKMQYRGALILVYIAIIFGSCKAPRDVVYFQDLENLEEMSPNINNVTIYKPLDIISVKISAPDPEAAIPFNSNGINTLTNEGSNQNSDVNNGAKYLIDDQGMIQFPILGSLKVGGLSNIEVKKLLKEKLKMFINEPIVSVKLSNFKITILGEVKNPGLYNLDSEKTTIIEVLGMAGDLGIQAKRTNITVIRQKEDKQIVYKLDLTSKDIFNSPAYFITQNDFIYVEPNNSKVKLSRTSDWQRNLATVGSILSIIISVVILTR